MLILFLFSLLLWLHFLYKLIIFCLAINIGMPQSSDLGFLLFLLCIFSLGHLILPLAKGLIFNLFYMIYTRVKHKLWGSISDVTHRPQFFSLTPTIMTFPTHLVSMLHYLLRAIHLHIFVPLLMLYLLTVKPSPSCTYSTPQVYAKIDITFPLVPSCL